MNLRFSLSYAVAGLTLNAAAKAPVASGLTAATSAGAAHCNSVDLRIARPTAALR